MDESLGQPSHLSSARLHRLIERDFSDEEGRLWSLHLMRCDDCRSRTLDALAVESSRVENTSLGQVVSFAEAEYQNRSARLIARSEWEVLQSLPKSARTKRLILSRVCHSREFLQLLITILRQISTRDEAESVARLALLAIKGLDAPRDEVDDLLAEVWIELANSRRLAADWDLADTALQRAHDHLGKESLLHARWHSIFASLQNDRGDRTGALETLALCCKIYEAEGDWLNLARTRIQVGHVLSDIDPARGVIVLDQAKPLIPASEPILLWQLEINRAECLVATRRTGEALDAWLAAEKMRIFHPHPKAAIRTDFLIGRILEALGYRAEAERLFKSVISADWEHSLTRDGFLDLLYLFTFYVNGGQTDRAAKLGRKALQHFELLGSGHSQLRDVWQQLIDSAATDGLELNGLLPRAREYFRVWWRRPAPHFPLSATVIPDGLRTISKPLLTSELTSGLRTLLARAKWEELRGLPKGSLESMEANQFTHTLEFLRVLVNAIKHPVSSRDAESAVRLSGLILRRDRDRDSPPSPGTIELTAEVQIEVANSRRLSADWESAEAALQQATEGVRGNRPLKARWLSVCASVRYDKGNRSESLELLQRSRLLYELEGDWYQVARSLVQSGMILVDSDPAQGLKLLNQARPLIEADDPILLWLLEINRTECLIETGQAYQALAAFRIADDLSRFQPRPKGHVRTQFTAGRLLEALGYRSEAERLFEHVVAADLEHSYTRDAFLDLLYFFSFYIKGGQPEQATRICRRALTHLELLDSVHEQIGKVWRQLLLVAETTSIDIAIIPAIKEYLRVWWKRPGPPPSFGFA